jgi:hypothetical protein
MHHSHPHPSLGVYNTFITAYCIHRLSTNAVKWYVKRNLTFIFQNWSTCSVEECMLDEVTVKGIMLPFVAQSTEASGN